MVPLGEALGDLSRDVEALGDLSRGVEALVDLSRGVEALGDLSRDVEALGDLSRTLSRGGEGLCRSEPSNRSVTGPYMPRLAKFVVSVRSSEIEISL